MAQNETDVAKIEETANLYVDEFCRELQLSSRIEDLSRTPLLCLLLIEVKRHAGRIPESRFKVYEKIAQFLVAEHPELRRQAAEATGKKVLITDDDTIEALGELAWEIQRKYRAGFAPREFCANVLETFLKDDVRGSGLPSREAKEITRFLLDHARTNLGLLVERSRDELGFFHLTLQEYLAARALTRRTIDDQLAEILARANEVGWYEVVVAWFGIQGSINRNRDLTEKAARSLQGIYEDKAINRALILPLLAELSFGDVGLPPRYVLETASRLIEEIERCPFPALQRELCRWAVLGLRSPKLTDLVREKLKKWYPARESSARFEMLRHMQNWERSEDVHECLRRCIYSSSEDIQVESARALANSDTKEAKEWLFSLASHEAEPSVRAAVIQSIVEKWPSEPSLPVMLDHEIGNDHPDIKFCAVEGRVRLGLHGYSDFEILWELRGYGSGLSWSRLARLQELLVSGWRKSADVRRILIEVVSKSHNDYDDRHLALGVLISSYRQDDEIAEILATNIEQSRGVLGMGSRDIWVDLLRNYAGHPTIVKAVEHWMTEREARHPGVMKHMGPDESFAFAIIGTEDVRQRLLSYLRETEADQTSKEWAVTSLEKGWPGKTDLAAFFVEMIDKPLEEVAWFANVSTEAIPEDGRRAWLLRVVGNPKVRSIRAACKALLSEWKDEEVLTAILEALTAPRWYYEIKSIKAQIVESFPSDPRILPLAEELWSDPDGSNAGAIAAMGDVNETMRLRVFTAVAPVRDQLRAATMESLASRLPPFAPSMAILEDTLHETDTDIGCAGVLALVSYIRDDADLKQTWTQKLLDEAAAIGFRMNVRNALGIVGLIKLGRMDLVKQCLDDRSRIELWLESDWNGRKDVFRMEILRHWDALKATPEGSPWKLLGLEEGRLWEALSAHCVRFPGVRHDAMAYLRTTFGKPVGPGVLGLMAAYFPRDENVLSSCFAVLQQRREDHRSGASAALRIVGQQFGGDSNVRQRLDITFPSRAVGTDGVSNDLLLALCYGWPQDPIIERFRNAPIEKWQGLNWEVACHLCRVTDSTGRMADVVVHAMDVFGGRRSYGIEPLVSALRMWTSGTGRDEMLEEWLKDVNPSKVVTAVALLALKRPISNARRVVFEEMFNNEFLNNRPPRVGLDMTLGVRRPIADSLYEAVLASQATQN